MKISIEINDDLMAKAKGLSGIENETILIEKALHYLLLLKIKNKYPA